MNLLFSPQAWADYQYWVQTDKKVLKRLNELLRDVARNGHHGIGKPEPLRHALAGYWLRRITEEHRLVYRLSEKTIEVAQARYHYE